jgi:hypothetical protein
MARGLVVVLFIALARAPEATAWCEHNPRAWTPEELNKSGVRVERVPESRICGAGATKLWVEVPSAQGDRELNQIQLRVTGDDDKTLLSVVVDSKISPREHAPDERPFMRTHDICLQNPMVKRATFSVWYGDFNKDCGGALIVIGDVSEWPFPSE